MAEMMSTGAIVAEHGEQPAPAADASPKRIVDRRPDVIQHAIFLVMAVAVVGAAFILDVGSTQKVVIPGLGIPLPSICQFKNMTGLDCPGCGLSRAFIHLAHGDLRGAWRLNPAAGLVFLFAVVQIPYRSVQLWRIWRGRPELDWRTAGNIAIGVLAVALISQWLVKMAWWIIG